ncbi:AmmeMemoRadiSam system protein B [Metallosphaera tengchongensis]|uniref:MEMO1 family protein GWK48_04375 n=1 Tax=Metallosphaera tengchongensis TaxID=1532350 RepID=A0A6N0NSL0_9CREN|nr:AmmeMemoRadiSam system protein B [Metallosphaera tengchongensis]QKQ99725.1 AmmeMemoRadiSam system protein B [Metallosphaera tengchongensis]
MIRRPAVAGSFYEDDPLKLRERIKWSFLHPVGPGKIPQLGSRSGPRENPIFIVPHAGYIYSGPVAAHSYYYLVSEGKPDLVIILGPNHTGYGSEVSIWPEGDWETPLGSARVQRSLVKELVSLSEVVDIDEKAHLYEHSIEVQLPFMQYFFDLNILPITILMQTPEIASFVAEGIWRFIKAHPDMDIVVLASSDLNHYDPHEQTLEKDQLVINQIVDLNYKELYRVVEEDDVTVCGYAPIMASLILSKKMGKKPHILKHATSGDTSGDKSSVVGYLAVRFGD